jgi:hypothetical protein
MERFLPNPFSPKNKEPEHATGARVEYEPVLNSVLTCLYCFGDSEEGTYWPQAKRLVWDCDHCGETNVIRNMEL